MLTSSQIHYRPPSHRSRRVSVLIAKFPDTVRYGNPRAAAGIRAIHRMQICADAFLGGGDYPHVHRRHTAFTTLILASAISSLRDTTRAHLR